VCGQRTRATETTSRPKSRAISHGYCADASAAKPPPPKQPQSICRPRAQARGDTGDEQGEQQRGQASRDAGSQPHDEKQAESDLEHGQPIPDHRHRDLGQQLVGAHSAHACHRVRKLDESGHEPNPANQQPGAQAGPTPPVPGVYTSPLPLSPCRHCCSPHIVRVRVGVRLAGSALNRWGRVSRRHLARPGADARRAPAPKTLQVKMPVSRLISASSASPRL